MINNDKRLNEAAYTDTDKDGCCDVNMDDNSYQHSNARRSFNQVDIGRTPGNWYPISMNPRLSSNPYTPDQRARNSACRSPVTAPPKTSPRNSKFQGCTKDTCGKPNYDLDCEDYCKGVLSQKEGSADVGGGRFAADVLNCLLTSNNLMLMGCLVFLLLLVASVIYEYYQSLSGFRNPCDWF